MTYGDTPREHLYTNNTVPYFRAPDLYVALAARFMQGRRVVTWKQGTDVSRYAGQRVRLRVALKDTDLYSFRFSRDDACKPGA